MRILIVGNLGYVGPVVVQHLRSRLPRAELIGFDTGFFAHCLTGTGQLPETALNAQHYGDIREFPPSLLRGVDRTKRGTYLARTLLRKQIAELILAKARSARNQVDTDELAWLSTLRCIDEKKRSVGRP